GIAIRGFWPILRSYVWGRARAGWSTSVAPPQGTWTKMQASCTVSRQQLPCVLARPAFARPLHALLASSCERRRRKEKKGNENGVEKRERSNPAEESRT